MPFKNEEISCEEFDRESGSTDKFNSFAKETMLELIEADDGRLLLRDVDGEKEALVTIGFSDKIKDVLGHDTQVVGQHMIHAAIQVIMQKQISQWHAYVYDQEPTHYS
ncbi:MAG: hypothetical protein Q4P13_12160 [Psychrobacter sp.]|nr:hypothetical protein [Psychrobacter sp.]